MAFPSAESYYRRTGTYYRSWDLLRMKPGRDTVLQQPTGLVSWSLVCPFLRLYQMPTVCANSTFLGLTVQQ